MSLGLSIQNEICKNLHFSYCKNNYLCKVIGFLFLLTTINCKSILPIRCNRLNVFFRFFQEENPKGLTAETSRNHIFQVLRGIEFCHKNNVRLHATKNIKPGVYFTNTICTAQTHLLSTSSFTIFVV